MEVCGVLRHVVMATHNLQEEDKVQSTSSACPEGGHQGHSRPQVRNDQQNMSSTQGTHAGRLLWNLAASGGGLNRFGP